MKTCCFVNAQEILTYGCHFCRLRFVDLHLITGAIMPVLPTILKAIDVKIGGRCVSLPYLDLIKDTSQILG